MQIFKLLIKKLFYTYYKIVKLHTGYKIKNIQTSILLFIISTTTLLLNENFIRNCKYTIILLLVGIIYIIYLQFNLLIRLSAIFL